MFEVGKSTFVLSVWCALRHMLEQAQLPCIWRFPPLRLFLCPPAALCCQVRPERPALIMAMSLTATLTRDVAMSSAGQDDRGTPRSVFRSLRRGDHLLSESECVCVCVCVGVWVCGWVGGCLSLCVCARYLLWLYFKLVYGNFAFKWDTKCLQTQSHCDETSEQVQAESSV